MHKNKLFSFTAFECFDVINYQILSWIDTFFTFKSNRTSNEVLKLSSAPAIKSTTVPLLIAVDVVCSCRLLHGLGVITSRHAMRSSGTLIRKRGLKHDDR